MPLSNLLLAAFCSYCLFWQSHFSSQPPDHCLSEAKRCTLAEYPVIPSQLALLPPRSSEIFTSTALTVHPSAEAARGGSDISVPYHHQEHRQGDPSCDYGMSWCPLLDSAPLTSIQNKTLQWQATVQDLPCLPSVFLHTSEAYPPMIWVRDAGRLFHALGTNLQLLGPKTRTREWWYDCRGPHHSFVVTESRYNQVWIDGRQFLNETAWCIQWGMELTHAIRKCDLGVPPSVSAQQASVNGGGGTKK